MLGIIIPYYKKTFFEKTLSSLANQTNKNFAVYIGDDASPEEPTELLQKFHNELNITYKRFDLNIGKVNLTKHWDRSIALSREEEWIMILGDDDFLSENFVEEFYRNRKEAETLGIQVIRFASIIVDTIHNKESSVYEHPRIEKSTDFFCRKFLKKTTRGSLSEQIFTRKAYNTIGFRRLPLGWGADNMAWLEFSNFGNILSINSAIAYITMSGQNISRDHFQDDLKALAKQDYFNLIISLYLEKFKRNQRKGLLLEYEKLIYKSGNISFNFWSIMCYKYFQQKEFLQLLKFNRRLFLNKVSK